MFCSTCGAATTTSAHFCDACGSPLLTPGSFSDGPPSPAIQPAQQQALPGAMPQSPVPFQPGGALPGVARPGPDATASKQQIRLLRQQVKGVRLQLQEVNIQLTQIHTQYRQGSPFVPYGLVRRFYREVENVRLSGLQRQKQSLRQQIVGLEQQILTLENSQIQHP
jgi:hypothetical protein